MSRRCLPLLPAAIVLATIALGACNKSAPDAAAPGAAGPATAASATGAPAATASVDAATASLNTTEPPLPELGDFRLVSVLIGSGVDDEQLVIADTRSLAASEPIYASVLSIGAHPGLKLSADWIGPDGKSFAKTEQSIVPDSDLATTFKVQNPQAWPLGDYQLRIAINGHTVRTEPFAVQ